MGILSGDIKLVASQQMSDNDNGGGAPSATLINDGTSNSIFPDISELDRAGGRVNLRKVFPSIRANNTDGYYGANVIVAEAPNDPLVSITLFTTDDTFDRRTNAANRMESYLAKGPTYSGYLLGNHIAGQMTVTLIQRNEVALPVVGQTIVLTKNDGLSNMYDQYVRVTDVSSTVRTFTDTVGDFQRTQVVLDISDPLQEDFNGFEPSRYDTTMNYSGKTRVSETIIADASRYYGVVPLVEAAAIGDFTVKGDSIYTQLVPSTRIETPIADARMNQQLAPQIDAGGSRTISLTLAFTTTQALYIGGGIAPGTLSIARSGVTITDKGGTLVNGGTQVGLVDYANGIATLSTNVFGTASGTHNVTYAPAAQPTTVSETLGLIVTTEGQRLSWTFTLDPVPAKGSLQISYRALGKWYVLSEDGSGAIRGSDSAFGAGTLNFSTGTVSVTLGALPDIDSRIISAWAPKAASRVITAVPTTSPGLSRAFERVVALPSDIAVKPNTITLTWNDGIARTATDSAGLLTGDATGAVTYGSAGATIRFRPNVLPAKGTTVNIALTDAVPNLADIGAFTDGGSVWNFNIGAGVRARTVELAIVASYPNRVFPGTDENVVLSLRVFDDGSGNLQIANVTGNLTVGSINYSTGACSISKTAAGFKSDQPVFENRTPLGASGDPSSYIKQTGYETREVLLTFLNGPGSSTPAVPAWAWWTGAQNAAAKYRYSGSDGVAKNYSFIMDSISLGGLADAYSTSPYSFNSIISGFTLGGLRYVVQADKVIREPSPTTGQGIEVGTVAYPFVTLDQWTAGISPIPSLIDGVQSPSVSGAGSLQLVDSATFRTAVSPLLNGGFSIIGNRQDGTQFNAAANNAGLISTGTAAIEGVTPPGQSSSLGSVGVFGYIDYETGVADIRFGRRVPSNWPSNDPNVIDISELGIPGITKLYSVGVQGDTLRYNAVGYSYLSLDPDILGLNPVRLPADGRVPIFRPGSFVVLGNTGTVGPATVSNGQTINCGRVRLSRVRVIGSDNQVIDAGYTADLDAGTVTFTNVSGYAQPVKVEHRIEDMMLVRDVQINGQLSFTRPVTHAYPADTSYISSALVIGDMQAYVATIFDQATWDGTWSDVQSGSAATGTYNDVLHPIEVSNLGALTERWAVVFTNSTSFNVIGEHVGVIATGTTGADCSPLNPATSTPYFTIRSAGWGLGWSVGNVMRFNTEGGIAPVWVVRTILQGPETEIDHDFTLLIRGDVDRP